VSYIDETLSSGEVVKYRTRLHWVAILWPILATLFFGVGAVALLIVFVNTRDNPGSGLWVSFAAICGVVAAFALGAGMMRRSSTEMAVTNRRVLMKSGVMSRKTVELMLSKVESIGVNQGVMGRLTGYGSIVVRGTGGTYELFDRISRPLEFRRKVQEQIDQLQPSRAERPEGLPGS